MPKTFLSPADMTLLQSKGSLVCYADKQVILHQNAPCEKMYWVRSGSVKIDFSRLYGNDVLAYLGEGELFGEISFMDHRDTSANASANKMCEILEVPRDTLETMLVSDDALSARFYRTVAMTLAMRVRAANRY